MTQLPTALTVKLRLIRWPLEGLPSVATPDRIEAVPTVGQRRVWLQDLDNAADGYGIYLSDWAPGDPGWASFHVELEGLYGEIWGRRQPGALYLGRSPFPSVQPFPVTPHLDAAYSLEMFVMGAVT